MLESSPAEHIVLRIVLRLEKSVQLLSEPLAFQTCCALQGNEHHIHIGRHFGPIQSEVFPEPSLDPISRTSVSTFPAHGHSQPRSTNLIPGYPDDEMGRAVTSSLLQDTPIVGGIPNSVLPGQSKALPLRLTGAYVLLLFFA